MIAIIRISGKIEIPHREQETLHRLRIRKKFSCVVLHETPEVIGMLKRARNFVAFGKIDQETLVQLIMKRGKIVGKGKIDADKVAKEILEGKVQKRIEDFGLKPFFSLHPPRGGIDSKTHFPRGILGDNKEKINELIMRML